MSEHLTEDGLFSMDIALVLDDGTKLALEVDGPKHFMSNRLEMPTAETQLRNLFLDVRGWKVLVIHVIQWQQAVRCSKEAGVKFLTDLLESAGWSK